MQSPGIKTATIQRVFSTHLWHLRFSLWQFSHLAGPKTANFAELIAAIFEFFSLKLYSLSKETAYFEEFIFANQRF